jgi:hypothetical protein
MYQTFATPLLAVITKYCVATFVLKRQETIRIIATAQVVSTRHIYKLWGDIRKVVTETTALNNYAP